jgi:hypothetical protein
MRIVTAAKTENNSRSLKKRTGTGGNEYGGGIFIILILQGPWFPISM